MSARSSARFTVMLLAAGAAPAAGAAELGQTPAAVEAAGNASVSISFPIFLDASRFVLMQAAWRSRIDAQGRAQVLPVVAVAGEPEVETLNEARRTLSRGEEVSLKAIAVRARAEELSRRFAIEVSGESNAKAQSESPEVAAAPEASIADTASIGSEAAAADVVAAAPEVPSSEAEARETANIQQVSVQQVSLSSKMPADVAPASMLGGPRVEKASAEDAAPVIEDMATKPVHQAKRGPTNSQPRRVAAQVVKESPTLFGIFSSWGSSEPEQVETTVSKSNDPDSNPMLPREIRSFGWNAQP